MKDHGQRESEGWYSLDNNSRLQGGHKLRPSSSGSSTDAWWVEGFWCRERAVPQVDDAGGAGLEEELMLETRGTKSERALGDFVLCEESLSGCGI